MWCLKTQQQLSLVVALALAVTFGYCQNDCQNGGLFIISAQQCFCLPGFTGSKCEIADSQATFPIIPVTLSVIELTNNVEITTPIPEIITETSTNIKSSTSIILPLTQSLSGSTTLEVTSSSSTASSTVSISTSTAQVFSSSSTTTTTTTSSSHPSTSTVIPTTSTTQSVSSSSSSSISSTTSLGESTLSTSTTTSIQPSTSTVIPTTSTTSSVSSSSSSSIGSTTTTAIPTTSTTSLEESTSSTFSTSTTTTIQVVTTTDKITTTTVIVVTTTTTETSTTSTFETSTSTTTETTAESTTTTTTTISSTTISSSTVPPTTRIVTTTAPISTTQVPLTESLPMTTGNPGEVSTTITMNPIQTTNSATIEPSFNSTLFNIVYQGVLQGLESFSQRYLSQYGIDLSNLSQTDVETLLGAFTTILINETQTVIVGQLGYNPYSKTDRTLQDKIAHLSENLMVVISFQFNNFVSNNNNDESDLNSLLKAHVQALVLQFLKDFEASLGITFDDVLNQIIADQVASYVTDVIINTSVNDINNVINGLLNSSGQMLTNLFQNFENILFEFINSFLNIQQQQLTYKRGLKSLLASGNRRSKRSLNEMSVGQVLVRNLGNSLRKLHKQKKAKRQLKELVNLLNKTI